MKKTSLEKKAPSGLKEKGQYTLGFSVIALMLYVAGFPIFLLFFVGVLAFFVWKVFSAETRTETRRIFEFYLSANELLREDDRRWYGFEIQETIARGEAIVGSMSAAPPLVYFGLGALYQKLDDHSSAVKNLVLVVEGSASAETAIVFPTKDLRDYVRMLRKIERFPAEAPMTSSAVRALERARKNRGKTLLEFSRSRIETEIPSLPQSEQTLESVVDITEENQAKMDNIDAAENDGESVGYGEFLRQNAFTLTNQVEHQDIANKGVNRSAVDRKTISEVLHDIYDKNIQ